MYIYGYRALLKHLPDFREKLRDELSGLCVLVNLLDSVLFGPSPEGTRKGEGPKPAATLSEPQMCQEASGDSQVHRYMLS